MPTYVYECSSCHKVFEVEQRITENALTDCTFCAKGKIKRVMQPTAIMFKGSGFYVNDSQAKAEPAAAAPEAATPAEPVAAASGPEAPAPNPAPTAPAPTPTPAPETPK